MRATPFLMFQEGNAEEAMNFYVSLLPDAEIASIQRYGPEGPGAEGLVMQARFRIAGLNVMCASTVRSVMPLILRPASLSSSIAIPMKKLKGSARHCARKARY